jgi:uncharacterized membrane protein YgdD (TMEM256/DUF423 family)
MPSRFRLRLTALLGLAGVLLGALGAHGHVHDVVSTTGYLDQWQTAVQYHQIHAVALLLLALLGLDPTSLKPRFRASFIAFNLGIFLFSGSLYLLSYTGIKWLGAITPLGGLSLMIGWLLLAGAATRPKV